ncbi:MAG: hypothetical protein BWY44_00728 [Candidatus Omnitrophica bacterium ADurb.Bin292]|nr:MAG: hypothetical protein BWY44_00728 [Candidatus Omnitrophica bacterium ADurb.Bin292]HPW76542.1 EpsG family protein [Candidatus Omnitrophota bacterium]
MIQSLTIYTLLLGIMMLCFYRAGCQTKALDYRVLDYYSTTSTPSFWSFSVIFPMLLFAVVFGMRYDVGVDHLAYLDAYLSNRDASKNELLFRVITDFSHSLNLNFVIYFAILAFIQVAFFFYAFKKEIYLFPLLIFFLFTNGDIIFWMNVIRQSIATCIWVCSLNFIVKKKFWRYVMFGVMAFLFHRSAIALFVFYPILVGGRDYLKIIPLQLVLFASAFVVKEVFFDVIMNFSAVVDFYISLLGAEMYEASYNIDALVENFKESTGTGLAYLWKVAINVIIIIYSGRLKKYYPSRWFNMIYFLYFVGLITYYMFPVGAISFSRPFRYLYIFQSIMLSYFVYYLYKNKTVNNAILAGLIILSFLGIFYLHHITSNRDSHLWYQFYFQSEINA